MKNVIRKGFTLIELAIVLTIVAMVIGGLSIPIGKHLVEKQYIDTQANIDKAVEAIVGFAILNRRLPCPDVDTNASVSIDNRDGIEDVAVTSSSITGCATGVGTYANSSDVNGVSWGDLPWQTLGLAAPNNADAWSNRLRYAVYTPLVTQAPQQPGLGGNNPVVCGGIGFANLTCLTPIQGGSGSLTGLIDIRCGNSSTTTSNNAAPGCLSTSPATYIPSYSVSTNAVFVVYSVGANGWGGTNINSTAVSKPFTSAQATLIPDQAKNAPELTTGTIAANIQSRKQFVLRARTDATSQSGEYDDVMTFVSSNSLVTRLVNAGVYP